MCVKAIKAHSVDNSWIILHQPHKSYYPTTTIGEVANNRNVENSVDKF